MIAVDGEIMTKKEKLSKITEKLGKVLKNIIPQLRICRGNEQCMDKMKTDDWSLLTSE